MSDKTLMVGVGISGTCNTGKTVLALKIANMLESLGIKDIKFEGLEMYDEQLFELQSKADEIKLDLPADATAYIHETRIPMSGKLPGGTLTARCKAEPDLTLEELVARYHNEQHPIYTTACWKNDVYTNVTTLGYWPWVHACINSKPLR